MYDVIGGSRLKFTAMSEHMDRLYDAVEGWLESQADIAVFTGEANSQRTKYVFRVEDVVPFPAEEWGIILGDAVHCLRSGLDQLVYGFADPAERGERTQFPICLTEKDWVTRAPAMYWGVSSGFAQVLEKMQPYQRGDMNAAREHPLAILSALSNLDKHRAIPSIALIPDDPKYTVTWTKGIEKWSSVRFKRRQRYEKGAVIAEATIVPDKSSLEPHMSMKVEDTFDIGFGEIRAAPTITNHPVRDVFEGMAEYVARLLNTLVDTWNQAVNATHTDEERERAAQEARRTYP